MTMEEVESDTRWGAGAFARCSREDVYGREMCKGEGMAELRARVLGQRDKLFSSLPAGRAAVLGGVLLHIAAALVIPIPNTLGIRLLHVLWDLLTFFTAEHATRKLNSSGALFIFCENAHTNIRVKEFIRLCCEDYGWIAVLM
eukprot:2585411-Pleurochrysis_carterae.AAC.3